MVKLKLVDDHWHKRRRPNPCRPCLVPFYIGLHVFMGPFYNTSQCNVIITNQRRSQNCGNQGHTKSQFIEWLQNSVEKAECLSNRVTHHVCMSLRIASVITAKSLDMPYSEIYHRIKNRSCFCVAFLYTFTKQKLTNLLNTMKKQLMIISMM